LKILLLDQDSQLGHALGELLASHPDIEWSGLSAAQLLEPEENIEDRIKEFRPNFIVNANSIELADSEEGISKSHVKKVKNLCRAAKTAGSGFIHISSAQVFNGARGKVFFETDRPKPKGRVSRRLVELEQAVTRELDRHIVVRTGWLFGADGQGAFQHFLEMLERGEEITVDQAVAGAPTAAADVARVLLAIIRQLDCGAPCWGIYHYCSSDTTDSRDFFETVLTMAVQYGNIASAYPLPELPLAVTTSESRHPRLDCHAILNTFGVKQRPWRSAMTGVLKSWYQRQPAVQAVAVD
jgi:dTDP-4-dehydrorhamnose reductase